jgi:predicted nucleic-acid-binding protein
MIRALDTNVLIRYITQDDRRQSPAASRFIEQELSPNRPGIVSLVTLLETVWVLEGRYGVEREPLCDLLDDLLATASLEVDQAPAVRQAVALYRAPGVDFHDALIATLAAARGAQTVTFDAKASRRLGMRLLV